MMVRRQVANLALTLLRQILSVMYVTIKHAGHRRGMILNMYTVQLEIFPPNKADHTRILANALHAMKEKQIVFAIKIINTLHRA